ncbi:unnamed protein product [Chrysoparadoxa australica]
MDGKLARATGSGSALGLLFDHGCDAVNVIFGTFIFATILGTGSLHPAKAQVVTALCFLNNATPFFFATWEEYFTNKLILPVINGPSEGVLIGVVLAWITPFVGPDFWWGTSVPIFGYTLSPAELLLGGSVLSWSATIIYQTANVLQFQRGSGRSLIRPLRDMLGYLILCVCGGLWLIPKPELYARHSQLIVILIGLLNVDTLCTLMLSHMCTIDFNPFRPILAPLVLACVNSYVLEKPIVSDEEFLLSYAVLTAVCVPIYIIRIVVAVREALQIYVFSLRKRKAE